jgi:phosphoserine phosphatase RsbU/P
MNSQLYERICYRILLSIGDSMDLREMLSRSLSSYIRELECTRGAVLLVPESDQKSFSLSLSFSIPRKIDRHASFNALYDELVHNVHLGKNEFVRKAEDGTYYVMGIGDIGLLILFKARGEIDEELLQALNPVNRRLGGACQACRQNEAFQKSSRRFMDMANLLPGIIMEFDRDYRITFFNRRTQEIFKQIDSNEFRPDTIFDFFPASEEGDVRTLLKQVERGDPMVTRDIWMQNSRGERFMVNLIISPISFRNVISGFRGIAIDITNRVKLEQDLIYRDRILHSVTLATQEMMRSSDVAGPLAKAFSIIGKAVGVDRVYCFVNSLDKQGEVVSLSQMVEWSADAVAPQIDNPELQDVPAEALEIFLEPLREKEPFIAVTRQLPESYTKTLLVSQGILSLLVLPVYAKDRFWGFIGFDDCARERKWSEIEQGLLELFAGSLAETIERKDAENEVRSLYGAILNDLDTAQTIQNYVLPTWYTQKSSLMMVSNYLPAEKIGGDLFDCIELSRSRYIVYMADISGHGVQAALIMTAVKSVIQMVAASEQGELQVNRIVTKLNSLLSAELFHENYMTLAFCSIDLESMTIDILSAGHPPIVLLNPKEGSFRVLDERGDIPLGWLPDYTYKAEYVQHVEFTPGDMICLLTDGVFDCSDESGRMLGVEQFYEQTVPQLLEFGSFMVPFFCYKAIADQGFHIRSDDFTFVALLLPPGGENGVRRYFLEAEGTLSHVAQIADACETFVREEGYSEIAAVKTKMVVSEFLSNIIRHGLTGRSKDAVLIELQSAENLTVIFRDRAGEWELTPREESFISFFDALNRDVAFTGRGMQMIYSATVSQMRRRCCGVNETSFTISRSD